MIYYLAPMEGITGYLFRNRWASCFGGAGKYFTPFLSPHTEKCFTSREKNDILPEHNCGLAVVPQILASQSSYFTSAAKKLKGYGYAEVNLNLGCPSGTVTAKKKGAGLLAYPEELNQLLEEIFNSVHGRESMKISIKTRLGMEREEEFEPILDIYNQYPLEELIIHPRVRQDFYSKPARLGFFEAVHGQAHAPVCYNGDIFTPAIYKEFASRFPNVDRLMLGRGVLVNPGLLKQLETGQPMEKETLRQFLSQLLEDYRKTFSGEKPALFKMKELWFYLAHSFTGYEPYLKKIKKANRLSDYEAAVRQLFEQQDLVRWE